MEVTWLRNRFPKKETEGMLLAEQEQPLITNSIKPSIDKISDMPLCRLCGVNTETVRHNWSMLKWCQKEYRYRHDKVAHCVRWEVSLQQIV